MPRYLDTSSHSNIAIAICQRCSRKVPYDSLRKDPNNGLRVCSECVDLYDPWRLPSRKTENIALRYPRPDEQLAISDIYDVVLEDGTYWVTDEDDFVIEDDNQILI